MAATGLLPVWLVIIIVFRDLLIVSGVLLTRAMGGAVTSAPCGSAR
jgi:cardiolipin synthase